MGERGDDECDNDGDAEVEEEEEDDDELDGGDDEDEDKAEEALQVSYCEQSSPLHPGKQRHTPRTHRP